MSDDTNDWKPVGTCVFAGLFALLAFLLSMGLGLNGWLVAFWVILMTVLGAALGSDIDDRIIAKRRREAWRKKTEPTP